MSVMLLCAAILFSIFALLCFRAAWAGTAAARRAIALQRRRIADVNEGRVELAGTIAIEGAAIVSPSGKSCAAVKVWMSGRTEQNPKSRRTVSNVDAQVCAKKVLLRDESGSVELDLENAELVAPKYAADGPTTELAALGEWLPYLDGETRYVGINETCIEDGARVVVYGHAMPMGEEMAQAQSDDAGYRGTDPKVRRTFRVEGLPYDRLVIAAGSERALLLRAAWPVALLVLTGSVFAAHAAAMALILSW